MAQICVVEDEETIRQLIVDELEDFGHEVVQASNGDEGLKTIGGVRPDLVISDINMPGMNGFEMRGRLLKDVPGADRIPFVFLSAYADEAYVADGMLLGADTYLTKPIDFDLLIQWVDRLTA